MGFCGWGVWWLWFWGFGCLWGWGCGCDDGVSDYFDYVCVCL